MNLICKTVSSLLIVGLFNTCQKADPQIPNEEELITTLTYTLISDDGTEQSIWSFEDLDGEGGKAPTFTTGDLHANRKYVGTLKLLNKVAVPVENITDEIRAEAEEHQFFFHSTLPGLTIEYADHDANGNPVGINTTLTTKDAGSGIVTITLRHEPDKAAVGVSTGNILNAGGETDIEITFTINVN